MTVSSFVLPFPPSSNGLWFNTKNGRARSASYDQWRQEAGWELKRQHPSKLKGPVSLNYVFENAKDNRKRDLGNLEKALSDLLVEHQIIEADDHTIVRRISLAWGAVDGVCVTVVSHCVQEMTGMLEEA
jgi:crossover junction endodeoxyribonuclease RusA